jgi:epoxyqueuosine reductase
MDSIPVSLKESIRLKAAELGFCAAGFAAVSPQPVAMGHLREMVAEGRHGEMRYIETGMAEREDPSLLLAGIKTVLSAAIAGPVRAARDETDGLLSAHAAVPDYHRVVRNLLMELLEFIRAEAVAPVNGLACVDGAPVLEKAWAEAAGIGRTGKNTLLIVPGAGSMIFLGELLLDIDIEPDEPLDWDPCGNCIACLNACPTGALTAAGRIDARRCISYMTIELKRDFSEQEAAMTAPWLFGCDRCMEACPHNQTRSVPPHPAFTPYPDIAKLTAEKVLELTGSTFRKHFADTTVMRLGLKRLKRNAKAVIEKKPRESRINQNK